MVTQRYDRYFLRSLHNAKVPSYREIYGSSRSELRSASKMGETDARTKMERQLLCDDHGMGMRYKALTIQDISLLLLILQLSYPQNHGPEKSVLLGGGIEVPSLPMHQTARIPPQPVEVDSLSNSDVFLCHGLS